MKIPQNIEEIIEELMDQYLEDDRYNRPWIIGFSGGKDSTVLLTLTWLALQRLKEQGLPIPQQVPKWNDFQTVMHLSEIQLTSQIA